MIGRSIRKFAWDWLALLTLTGFAVAQPLYILLGENAEFLVAHQVNARTMFSLVLLLSFGISGAFTLVSVTLNLLSPPLRKAWMTLLSSSLVMITALPFVNRLGLPYYVAAGLVVFLGIIALYFSEKIQDFSHFASPISVAFPVLFLFFSPATEIVFPHDVSTAAADIKNPVPIVMIVFDEFNLDQILDADGEIDRIRYPNFAMIAENGTWFRNATAVHSQTRKAVPAIMTGKYPPAKPLLPTYTGHPDNIFSWLASSYRLNVHEPVTSLCPPDLCTQEIQEEPSDLLVDTTIVYLHYLLPTELAAVWLPSIGEGWGDFVTSRTTHGHLSAPSAQVANEQAQTEQGLGFRARAHRAILAGRAKSFEDFIDSVDASERVFNFLHILLPHRGWTFSPDGRKYPQLPILDEVKQTTAGRERIAAAYQRSMLQIGLADTMLGRLIAKLKSSQQYESALIILTADHGIAFPPEGPSRELTSENASAVLRVPMLIKWPNENRAEISNLHARTIDLVPTIADVLKSELPWQPSGLSLLDPAFPLRDKIEVTSVGEHLSTISFPAEDLLEQKALQWQARVFGSGIPLSETVIRAAHPEIVGLIKSDIRILPANGILTAELYSPELLNNVDMNSNDGLPILLRGHLVNNGGGEAAGITLAVVFNGKIALTLRTFLEPDGRTTFDGVLPEAWFVNGKNTVELFEIVDAGGILSLLPVDLGEGYILVAHQNGASTLRGKDGKELLAADKKMMTGFFRVKYRGNGQIDIAGWGVNQLKKTAMTEFVIFNGRSPVYSGRPNRENKKALERFGVERTVRSAFKYIMPQGAVDWENEQLRIFITDDVYSHELTRCKGHLRWC